MSELMDFNRPKSPHANNLVSSIHSNVKKNPNLTAIFCNGRSETWAQMWERTNRLGRGLLNLGLSKGDRVAIVLKNSLEFSELYVATAKTGLIKSPMNFHLKAEELAYQMNNCEASALVVHVDLMNIAAEVKEQVPSLKHIIVVGSPDGKGTISYETLIEGSSVEELEVEVSPNDIEILLYTSGTTGRPKGVVRGFAENYNVGITYCAEAGIQSGDVLLTVPPQYHVGPCGTYWATLVAGGTQIIMDGFDPELTLKNMEIHKVNWTMMVPTMYNMILSLPEEVKKKYDLSSLKTLICGGSSLHTPTKVKIKELFSNAELNECYGSTELAMSTILHDVDQMRKERSVGKPWMNMEVRLLDKNGNDVPQGEVGILYSRGPGLFRGYWKNAQGTREAFLDDEWATVGDLAQQDEDGYYYIIDRAVDMIISGGVNVYPIEIEDVIYKIDGVLEAAVIGVPDPKWGEAVKALVVCQPGGGDLTEEGVIARCKECLAGFKAPKSVEFVDTLPKTASGKIMKNELRKPFWNKETVKVS